MCCPPLLVISPHCDMRTIAGGNGKDSKKEGLAIMGRAGGRMYRRGSWLSTGSLEVRFERLRKLRFSKTFFPFQGLLPMGPLFATVSGRFPSAEPMSGDRQLFYKVFFIKDFHSGRICTQVRWAWVTSQVLLRWDSSCPK